MLNLATLQEYYKARDLIEELLRQDLIGPVHPREILRERPDTSYSLGILWPRKSSLVFEEIDQMALFETEAELIEESYEGADLPVTGLEDDLEEFSGKIVTANLYKPSGLTITVLIPASVDKVQVRFTGARYFSDTTVETYERKTDADVAEPVAREVRVFKRRAYDTGQIDMPIVNDKIHPEDFADVEISLFVRYVFGDKSRLVTVCVTNRAVLESNNFVTVAENAIFQSCLNLSVAGEFLHLGDRNHQSQDWEAEILNLLYREAENYATGHGCAVKWNIKNGSVRSVTSEFVPRVDLTPMEPRNIDQKLRLDLKYWAECKRELGLANLQILVDRYREWFSELKKTRG